MNLQIDSMGDNDLIQDITQVELLTGVLLMITLTEENYSAYIGASVDDGIHGDGSILCHTVTILNDDQRYSFDIYSALPNDIHNYALYMETKQYRKIGKELCVYILHKNPVNLLLRKNEYLQRRFGSDVKVIGS